MNNVAPADDSGPPTLSPGELALAPRFELYRAPHKALRYILCNLLVRMGRASFGDSSQAGAVTAALAVVLDHCDRHVRYEEDWLRPALVEQAPTAVATLDSQHQQHATHVAELRSMSKVLGAAEDHRTAIGRSLYLHFSAFVAETLAHMAYEECVVQPLIDRDFAVEEELADADAKDLQERIGL